jgi:capsular polysaccharide biosynthesis protein
LAGCGNFRPEYLRLLNKRFTFGIKNKNINPIIFIDRRKRDREIFNQNYLNFYLKKKKIHKVYMEDLSLQKQIKLANQARIIIGIHGGGLANILWMNLKKKNVLIEIRDKYDDHNNCYFNLTNALNINYLYLKSENLNNIKQYSKRLTGNFKIDINDLDYLIKLAMKKID